MEGGLKAYSMASRDANKLWHFRHESMYTFGVTNMHYQVVLCYSKKQVNKLLVTTQMGH